MWGKPVQDGSPAHRDALELRLVEQVVQFILGRLYLLLVGSVHHVPAREGTPLSTVPEVPAPRCCAEICSTTKPCSHGSRVAPAGSPLREGDVQRDPSHRTPVRKGRCEPLMSPRGQGTSLSPSLQGFTPLTAETRQVRGPRHCLGKRSCKRHVVPK